MKRILIFFCFFSAAACSSGINMEKLSHWGTEDFSKEKWQGANTEQRAKMVFQLLKQNNFVGKSPAEVRAVLGEPTGYYDYDTNLAYPVGKEGEVDTVYANTYLLVFITDKEKTGNIAKVITVPDL